MRRDVICIPEDDKEEGEEVLGGGDERGEVMEMLIRDSATRISGGEGSKKMLGPTEMRRRVIGGAVDVISVFCVGLISVEDGIGSAFLPFPMGAVRAAALKLGVVYRGIEASQSSLNKGSSSPVETGAGSTVSSNARCVAKERRGSGRVVGGESRRIYSIPKSQQAISDQTHDTRLHCR